MGLPSFLWSGAPWSAIQRRLFSLLLAAHYQPAASRFRQKSSVRAASGDFGTAKILAVPRLLLAVPARRQIRQECAAAEKYRADATS
jgi:hypothetical protein